MEKAEGLWEEEVLRLVKTGVDCVCLFRRG